ncbi:transposase [Paenibacillus alginolyticus]|uniref:transposase n=1 Tax=Paenibacillus alginolyticus TaxID=59839 RepID=UPI0007E8E464|nr:transposase [Paenibacillus alginolyticus]MCY9667932.1 transposase [Paenibacillus alginolyticus]
MNFACMSLDQFQNHFSTDSACIAYIFHTKWPEGFICPRCKHSHAYVTTTRRLPLYECCHCRHQTSLISGTIMEGSRTELRKWILSLFLFSHTNKGTTATELSKFIKVTYKTAWLILHKIRSVIHSSDNQNQLSGSVCINSAIYGRPYNPSVHKHRQEHLLLVGSSVNEWNQFTHLKIKHVLLPNPKERHIPRIETKAFHQQHIESDTQNVEIVTGFYTPSRLRPLLIFAKQASKWINNTFHGLGPKHLQKYLDEFSYRLNLSSKNIPIFAHLVQLCIKPSSYQ